MKSAKRSTRSSSGRSVSIPEESSSLEEPAVLHKKKGKKLPPVDPPSQWVTIVPEEASNTRGRYPYANFVDPKTGTKRNYLLNEENHKILEIQKCSDEPRSWFIGETVQTDGSLLICTAVDPLFLALPYLKQAAKLGKFTTLEAILDDPESGNNGLLLERYIPSEQWKHVCDVKILSEDISVYRYSQAKTLNWLKKKVEVVATQLQEQKTHVGSGSWSSTLIKNKKDNLASQEEYLKYACGITCEYLDDETTTLLSAEYKLKEASKRQQEDLTSGQPSAKRQRTESVDSGFSSQQSSSVDDSESGSQPIAREISRTSSSQNGAEDGPLEDYTKYNSSIPLVGPPSAKKMSQSHKALAKADKRGMKSISSFFGKSKT